VINMGIGTPQTLSIGSCNGSIFKNTFFQDILLFRKHAGCVQGTSIIILHGITRSMAYILDKDGVFEVRKSGQGTDSDNVDSGNGVFCSEDVKAGTCLPYYGVAFKESKATDEMERTFVIGADYNNSKGDPRTSKTYSIDGNPHTPPVSSLEEYKKLGCQVNEASKGSKVNCLFIVNPFLEKGTFKESFVKQEPIVATLIVVTEDLVAGTELLTTYGSDYGKRDYSVCKMKRKEHDRMVDYAYSFVDSLCDQYESKEEPDKKKIKT